MSKPNPYRITPAEMARLLGKENPATIRAALRRGDYPVGTAYEGPGGRYVYDVPRAAFMEFLRTGRAPSSNGEMRRK